MRTSGLLLAAAALASTSAASHAAPLETAAAAFAARDYAAAVRLLPAPKTPRGLLLRGRALIELGRHRTALRALTNLQVRLPLLADLIWYLRGEALFGARRYVAAARAYAHAIETKPSRFVDRARLRRAEAFRNARRYWEAIGAYRKLVDSHPDGLDQPAWRLALAEVYLRVRHTRRAAELFQMIWLRWPETAEAARAEKHRRKLRASRARVSIRRPDAAHLIERARRLRRAKRFDDAIGGYRDVAKAHPKQAFRCQMAIAYTLRRAGRMLEAQRLYAQLYPQAKGAWSAIARKHLASCLAHSGRLKQAVRLYEPSFPSAKTRRLRDTHQRALVEATLLLAAHGRYDQALKLYRRLPVPRGSAGNDRRQRRAWLAYRAGNYRGAIEAFASLPGANKSRFVRYWNARAMHRAGDKTQALQLYAAILADHPRRYYGLLARSRLVEAGKLTLTPGKCVHRRKQREPLLPLLESLTDDHARLLPGLRRARALLSMGMRADARREIRLVALDYAWARSRGRWRAFRTRPIPLRHWTGAPLPKSRAWGRRQRLIRQKGDALRYQLAGLMAAAGFDYYAWRMGPANPDPERQTYPQAFRKLVLRTAKKQRIRPSLVWAIIRTESAFRSDAISPVNAAGLMQLMPTTAKRQAKAVGLKDFTRGSVFDPPTNLALGANYLAALMRKFHGQVPLAAAGYNGGPHNIARWLDYRGKGCALDEFVEEIPFAESRRYAKKIVRLLSLYERAYCGKDDMVIPTRLDTRYEPHPNY